MTSAKEHAVAEERPPEAESGVEDLELRLEPSVCRSRVVDDFVDVFPTVRELRVATYAEFGFRPHLGDSFMAGCSTWRPATIRG